MCKEEKRFRIQTKEDKEVCQAFLNPASGLCPFVDMQDCAPRKGESMILPVVMSGSSTTAETADLLGFQG